MQILDKTVRADTAAARKGEMHQLDEAIELAAASPSSDIVRARTHPAFANMVGPFGGITAAAMVNAILTDERLLGRPAALTLNFAAPISDGDYDISRRPVRTNNSNQHWTLAIEQDGQVRVTGTALTVRDRETWSALEAVMPQVPPPGQLEPAGPVSGLAWLRNYEMRFVTGVFPAGPQDAADDSTTTMWLRHADPRVWDFPALAAAADSFSPRIFNRLGHVVPAGTVTMTTYFLADAATLAAQGADVLGTVRAAQFSGGHADQRAQLWGADGSLLATSTQLCYFKVPAPEQS